MKQLSDSALEPLMEMASKDKDETKEVVKEYKNRIYEKRKWQEWNLVNYNAKKIFENIK